MDVEITPVEQEPDTSTAGLKRALKAERNENRDGRQLIGQCRRLLEGLEAARRHQDGQVLESLSKLQEHHQQLGQGLLGLVTELRQELAVLRAAQDDLEGQVAELRRAGVRR